MKNQDVDGQYEIDRPGEKLSKRLIQSISKRLLAFIDAGKKSVHSLGKFVYYTLKFKNFPTLNHVTSFLNSTLLLKAEPSQFCV